MAATGHHLEDVIALLRQRNTSTLCWPLEVCESLNTQDRAEHLTAETGVMATCHQVAGHVIHLVVLPKIFAALPSAEKHMCSCVGPASPPGAEHSGQSRASHGDDWPPLRGDDGHLSFTWCCWQGGDYTTTTTAAPTPTPCTFIALPDVDPTSCLGRVNHHRTKWVLPPQSENTALHGCVN